MFREDEPITCSYEEYRADPAFRSIWGAPRYAPSDLAPALAGLRTMPECDERNTLADTVWWDIVGRVNVPRAILDAVVELRPDIEWIPPKYSLEQHRRIRRKLEEWGWHFTR